jgi:hypothetical protein
MLRTWWWRSGDLGSLLDQPVSKCCRLVRQKQVEVLEGWETAASSESRIALQTGLRRDATVSDRLWTRHWDVTGSAARSHRA